MRKMVKESLNEFGNRYGDTTNFSVSRKEDCENKLQQVKKHCEMIIQGAEEYFQSLEDEGMDPDDLDMDELENYTSNSSASDLAHQILDIIKKSKKKN